MNSDSSTSGMILPDAILALVLVMMGFISLMTLGRGLFTAGVAVEAALLRGYAEEVVVPPVGLAEGEWGEGR